MFPVYLHISFIVMYRVFFKFIASTHNPSTKNNHYRWGPVLGPRHFIFLFYLIYYKLLVSTFNLAYDITYPCMLEVWLVTISSLSKLRLLFFLHWSTVIVMSQLWSFISYCKKKEVPPFSRPRMTHKLIDLNTIESVVPSTLQCENSDKIWLIMK